MTNMFLLAENTKKADLSWAVDIFTFIGIVVCIVATLIALVWLTCFIVRLLVKSFKFKVQESYNVMEEDIKRKAESKKERNAKKRDVKAAHKMELLNMKLESKAKVHEMKKQKLQEKLDEVENAQRVKLFGDSEIAVQDKKEVKKAKKIEPKVEVESEPEAVEEKKENA